MTIVAILVDVPAVPLPGPLAGGALPADGFAGLLAAALPMPPTLVEPETATVSPVLPVVDPPLANAEGAVLPPGTTIPIAGVVSGATAGASPARVPVPALAPAAAPVRLAVRPAAVPDNAALSAVAGRMRGLPKLPPLPAKIAAVAEAPVPAESLAISDAGPIAAPPQAVPKLRSTAPASTTPASDPGDDRGATGQRPGKDGAAPSVAAQSPRLIGVGAPVAADLAAPASPTVSGVVPAPMIRTADIAFAPAPVVAAPFALARIGAGRVDAAKAANGAHSVTVPPLDPRRDRMVRVALDDRLRDAPIGMAGAPVPAGPPIPLPGIAPPAPRVSLVTPTIVLSASPKGLMTLPAASGDDAYNVAADAAPPAPGVFPVRAVVSAGAPTAAAAMPVLVEDRAPCAASTPLQPVVKQVPLSQVVAGTAAPSADAAAAVEAGSPGAGAVSAFIAEGGSTTAGADRSGMGAAISRAAAAPAEPAPSSGDDRGDDRRDGGDRPTRGRAVAEGPLAPLEPGRSQSIPVASAPPMAGERAAVPAAPPASMSGAMAPDRAATAITVTTEQLGAVSIGVDDDAGHLRVRLSGSALAMDTVAAQAPRLVAELAATGVRLGSLDIAGRDSAQVPGGSVAASASAGDATSDQRAASGQAGAPAFTGGGTDARGAPSGDGRARSTAAIAALARGGIAGDPLAGPRSSPSDRYA